MGSLQSTAAAEVSTQSSVRALELEAGELDALHSGLIRHFDAWRAAHEAAILKLGAVMARMDALLERVER